MAPSKTDFEEDGMGTSPEQKIGTLLGQHGVFSTTTCREKHETQK